MWLFLNFVHSQNPCSAFPGLQCEGEPLQPLLVHGTTFLHAVSDAWVGESWGQRCHLSFGASHGSSKASVNPFAVLYSKAEQTLNAKYFSWHGKIYNYR